MTDHELDTLLADFHTDVPAMTDEAFAAGRARVQGITDSRAAAPTALDPVVVALTPERVRHGPRRRFLQLAAAAAAVVAVGAVTIIRGDTAVTPATVNTPAALAAWARGLADNPPPFGPGQYRYVHDSYRSTSDLSGVSDGSSETWIPYDYRDEWQLDTGESHGAGVFGRPPGTQRAKCGAFTNGMHITYAAGNGNATSSPDPCTGDGWRWAASPEFYRTWSGDAQKLYDELYRKAVDRGSGLAPEIFVQARVLPTGAMPNEFRATLYEALSRTPGLEVRNNATTRDGRTGIGLRVSENGATELWILDRETGDLLENREITPDSDWQLTATYGVTDRIGVRPAR